MLFVLFVSLCVHGVIEQKVNSGILRWGRDGHAMTAIIAQYFLSDKTQAAINELIPNGDLEAIASWADEVRNEPAFAWSEKLHFINIPNYNCTFIYKRDCVDNWCVAGAIRNYTQRAVDKTLSLEQRSEALKFVVHFVGDIHQPLHVGWTTDRGGNTIHVELKFGHFTNTENLHAVWDEYMIYNEMDANFSGNHTLWAENSIIEIKTGTFQGEVVKSWLDCPSGEAYPCSTSWAEESIGFACKNAYRYKNGNLIKSGDTLYEDYYEKNINIVENRIARAGYRLAQTLNMLYDS